MMGGGIPLASLWLELSIQPQPPPAPRQTVVMSLYDACFFFYPFLPFFLPKTVLLVRMP